MAMFRRFREIEEVEKEADEVETKVVFEKEGNAYDDELSIMFAKVEPKVSNGNERRKAFLEQIRYEEPKESNKESVEVATQINSKQEKRSELKEKINELKEKRKLYKVGTPERRKITAEYTKACDELEELNGDVR